MDNLRFYRSLSWRDKDVAGVVNAGLEFAIDVKVNANGLYQYKIHKSKGKTCYVTGSQAYICEIKLESS
ncbi:N-acetylmuramoyl-L-alanine amidase [Bacillus toyonensis]|uniref:N-acetylmuramoyl-L-alanine amidase n=1 Tax=Bacillus toyonensis TaxID=155322 RepID=UPI0021CF0B96|nr:N-acetylmuramoyl-L-alanine amidase [Bacillus toyonensis]MCU5584452.1 N-acetylmuramoyl-L-alanine amidase [Bacillus toyonensis]